MVVQVDHQSTVISDFALVDGSNYSGSLTRLVGKKNSLCFLICDNICLMIIQWSVCAVFQLV